MLSAPRMLYAMARIGSLPAWFGAVHPRLRTPANAIGFYAVFSIALALSGGFVWLAAMSTVVRLLVYVMSIATLPCCSARSGSTRASSVCRAVADPASRRSGQPVADEPRAAEILGGHSGIHGYRRRGLRVHAAQWGGHVGATSAANQV
jgi:hypothetical protein